MDIKIRLEQEEDHRIVEELTREAFWNLFHPGAGKHFLITCPYPYTSAQHRNCSSSSKISITYN